MIIYIKPVFMDAFPVEPPMTDMSANTMKSNQADNKKTEEKSKKVFTDVFRSMKRSIRDIKKFITDKLAYIEDPIKNMVGIIDTIVLLIVRIFSNYNELENDCNLTKELLDEIGNNKINDQGILKSQIYSILSVPLTGIIMYNWLYLTCFKERFIIYSSVDEWIKSSIAKGISSMKSSINNFTSMAEKDMAKLGKEANIEGISKAANIVNESGNEAASKIADAASKSANAIASTIADGIANIKKGGQKEGEEGEEGEEGSGEEDPLFGWKVYAPILHALAPISIIDKWIFTFFYIINAYLISPNLRPLLYYIVFFAMFFRFVRNHRDLIRNTVSSTIDYIFSEDGTSLPFPEIVSQLTTLFITWSFISSIPEGIMRMSTEFWIVTLIKVVLFIVSYFFVMRYVNTICVFVVLYMVFYSFMAIVIFSKVGVSKTIHGMDVYFYKRIAAFQNKNNRILSLIINMVFLYFFEIIIFIYLLKGISDYLIHIEAIELKITMTLVNVIIIYLLVKYCSYKFNTLWPTYKNDIKDEFYTQIRKEYFTPEIPIESYADGANSYNPVADTEEQEDPAYIKD